MTTLYYDRPKVVPYTGPVDNSHAPGTWASAQRVGDVGTKSTLCTIAGYADERWSCYPGQDRLAHETEQSVSTIRRQLKRLESLSLIRREHRYDERGKRTSDRFFLNWKIQVDVYVPGEQPPPDGDGVPDQGESLPANVTGSTEGEAQEAHNGLPGSMTGSDSGTNQTTTGHQVSGSAVGTTVHGDATTCHQVAGEVPGSGTTRKNTHPPSGGEYAHAPASADARTREGAPADAGHGAAEQGTLDGGPAAAPKRKPSRKQPWPGRFEPDEAMRAWAAKHYPSVDLEQQIREFNAFWDLPKNAQVTRDWVATWRKNVQQTAERGQRRPSMPPPTEQELAEVRPLAERWWRWCVENGRIFGEQQSALEARLVEFVRAGATEPQLVQALWVCQEPVPPSWKVAKALRGEIAPPQPGGPAARRSTTDQRVAQVSEVADRLRAKLAAQRAGLPMPDLPSVPMSTTDLRVAQVSEAADRLRAKLAAQHGDGGQAAIEGGAAC